MKKILIVLLLVVSLCGCSSSNSNKKSLDYKDIMATKEYVIIDVRTKVEYDESHVKGSINIPYDEINENINIDKNKVIFVYCRSGSRSSIAYEKLKTLNYVVYDLGAFSSIDLDKE